MEVTPIDFSQFRQGAWDSKALIRDKQKRENHILNLDIVAVQPDKLRVDATTPIGIGVMAFVMKGNRVEYALLQEKKFFRGPANEQAFKPVLGLELDPQTLLGLLFDKVPEDKVWTCSIGPDKLPKECRHLRQGLVVHWSERDGVDRRMELENDNVRVQILLEDFRSKVEDDGSLFSLSVPNQFKVYRTDKAF